MLVNGALQSFEGDWKFHFGVLTQCRRKVYLKFPGDSLIDLPVSNEACEYKIVQSVNVGINNIILGTI